MAKAPFDDFLEVVPRAVATAGLRERRERTPRPDRPLGRRDVDMLAGVPLFAGLSRRDLRRLAEHADVVSFRPHETIVEAGRPGGTFYVMLQGEASVTRDGRKIGTMAPGDFFGEISLLDGGPRTATVSAETPVTAIRIFKRSFDRVVTQEPAVASKILAVVARRLREAERSITG
jgi:CRP/FNR family transcriptional regulator, cyclic AMP receptor protein